MLRHPLHPALVHFPVALLLSGTIADLAWLAGFTTDTHVGAVLMAGGLASGLIAMIAGFADYIRLDERIVPHATLHMMAVGLAWLGYGVALYLRREALRASVPIDAATISISIVSSLILALGGWLGGRLVYNFGAGVSATPATRSAESQSPA